MGVRTLPETPFMTYADLACSISKSMGESFKLFSQSLCTYEDDIASDGDNNMLPMPDQNLMNMEAAY